jgi:hypothetical protein
MMHLKIKTDLAETEWEIVDYTDLVMFYKYCTTEPGEINVA